MSNLIKRLLPLLLLGQMLSGSASAQQNNRTPNLNLGDAVVTGFSGTLAPAAGKAANKSAIDRTFINPDGPSARIIGIAKPGYVWDGRLFPAPKTFDVLAKDVGQVFGIALDDATPSNIYLSATSAFGLNIVSRGRDGATERRKKGGPGAGWMKGQFGLDLQGGPGAIYKVDGRTGVATLFANVTLDGVPNPGPGLGNLAYDSAHKQLFVSDLYTGMIHRFDLEGKELGRYDHGVTTLGAAKQAPVAFNPANRPNIASDRFNSEKPDTWGFAPAARRVFALAVNNGRLYYSVLAGSKIWSVGIERDGGFAGDARLELDVPLQPGVYPVTDIAFAHSGTMILAERAPITATYDYSTFTRPAEPRVLRFTLKAPNDPPSPGLWKPLAEEYAVGLAGEYRNTNGGVALGYGYGKDGVLNTGACEAALWTTGQNLRNNPALRSQLEPGGPLAVHGLQGSPADLVRNANTPPMLSYFVDYIDRSNDPRASGHMGSVRVYAKPCAPSAYVQPVIAVVPIAIPGKRGGVCTPTCVCPPGTVLDGKECVKRDCPTPQHMNPRGLCVCPNGSLPVNGKCAPILKLQTHVDCTSPMIPNDNSTACICPPGSQEIGGSCVPVQVQCQSPLVNGPNGTCVCPQGSVQQGRKCVPQVCPAPLVPGPCECPSGTRKNGNECLQETPIDLGIQKTGGTTPVQEPFYDFTITVTNVGNAISNTNVITVTDTVPPNMTYDPPTGTGWTCVPPGGPAGTVIVCTYGPAVTAGQVLPPISINATATGSAPYPPVTNCAVVSVPGSSGLTDSNASNNQACVTVTKPGSTGQITVKKVVINNSPLALPAMTFPITVTCGSNATTMNLANGGSQTVTSIPFNTSCTILEGTITTPANACPPRFTPSWTTTYAPLSPIIVTTAATTETVTNTLDCKGVTLGSLVVEKTFRTEAGINNPIPSFPVSVSCMLAGNTTATANWTLIPNIPQTLNNIPLNSVCTITETQPAAPTSGCSSGNSPAWLPPQYLPSNPITITGNPTSANIVNTLVCSKTCPPPLVTAANNTCACPQGTTMVGGQCVPIPPGPTTCTAPQVMIPGVGCACPNGGTLVNGACVPAIVCKPPLVPSANGKDCVCPEGEVLRRGKCVGVETPKHKREKEKTCKQGEVMKNGACAKKHETGITGRDVIRVLPGLIPHLGGRGNGGGSQGGGGAVKGR